MMRVPILPTLLVTAAIALMIGLGVWQLQRAEWKQALISGLQAEDRTATPVTRDCASDAPPRPRAGGNRLGETGYSYVIACAGGALNVDIGWSQRPDALPDPVGARRFTGRLIEREGGPALLVADAAIAPLQPSAVPDAANLPNNHLMYALQWFFFAAAAAVIYVLALRRRRTPER